MSLVFINYPLETFTPAQSGALATIIWECCRVSRKWGTTPFVITRSSAVQTFEWADMATVAYPKLPAGRIGNFIARAGRKLGGWQHLRQGAYARRVVRVIRERRLDERPLVVLNDPEMAVFLRSRFPGAFIAHWFQNQQECKPWARARFGVSVNGTAAVSQFTAAWVENYYGITRGSVRVVHNAVDAAIFQRPREKPVGPPVINFVGRTGMEKGPDVLLKAALRLARNGLVFRLQLLGSNHWDRFELDDYQCELASLTDALVRAGIEVRRPGHIPRADLPRELSRAHIHVVPARWDEPFGMTTIEGMACGLATVASATGGTPEVAGDAALFFERESVEELASHLARLIREPELRAEYADRGRRRAEQFTWERTWSGLCELVAH